ncbi:MAG: rhamnan synthesis F family protein [Desulfomonilaceae bacterium]
MALFRGAAYPWSSCRKALGLIRRRKYRELIDGTLAALRSEWQVFFHESRVLQNLDAHVWSRFRSTRKVLVQTWPGLQSISDGEEYRLVLFAHHGSAGTVDDYVVYHMAALADLPAKIVFVTTAIQLSRESIKKIQPFCHLIILRKNVGWDFGSWKAALDMCPTIVEHAKTLILMNDSCYGPFGSLNKIVEALESRDNCLSGITANHEFAYHIQSYFLVFPSSVLKSSFFLEFKKGLGYLKSKRQVVLRYEVGTSLLAQEHGLNMYSWVKEECLRQYGLPLSVLRGNPTLHAWHVLLFKHLSPFLKKSLLGDSRDFLGDKESELWKYIHDQTDYPTSLIENHIFRCGIPTAKVWDWDVYREALAGLKGIEVGGPSDVFRSDSFLPVYDVVAELDGVNFAEVTIWQGRQGEGSNFRWNPGKPAGRLFISEATKLSSIPDREYDFLLASHVLEHVANPLKAIEEWLRILTAGGALVIVLPHKDFTFDHRRSVTPLDHVLSDYRNGVEEDDLTHLDEIMELHDLERDPQAGDIDSFRARSLNNYRNRCLHHHVFDFQLATACLEYFGLEVLSERLVAPFHQILLAKSDCER